MKFYKTKYEIPLYNWIMITENGFNLKYLLKKDLKRVSKKQMKQLYDTYINIVDTLKGMNFNTLIKYVGWQASLVDFRAEILKNKNAELRKEDYKLKFGQLEDNFREYLEEIETNYTNFEVTEYYFADNYKEIYKEITNQTAPKEIDIFKGIKFYDWFEYQLFAKAHLEILLLTVTPEFNEHFIKERIIKIDSLIELDTFLSDIFATNDNYNNYQEVRAKLFDLNSIRSERKKETSGFDEISEVGKILGFSIDAKKTSLAEFESHKQTAHRVAENMNKPKADTNGRI